MNTTSPFHSNEMRFRAYFDSTPDCMFHIQVEPDGRFTYVDVNAAGLAAAGLEIEDIRRREPKDIMGPVKGREMTEALQTVVETGAVFRYEPVWDMHRGQIVYDAVYIPLRDPSGTVTGILGSARNINERKRIEAALHQARKVEVIGQLASGIAHDFNNLMSAFQSCLRLLDKELTSSRSRSIIDEGHAALDRGKALTSWLAGFIRQEPVSLGEIDLNAALSSLEGMLNQALAPAISLQMDLASGPLPARADKNEIGLAILNLGLNARDAMPNGGVLTLSSRVAEIDSGQDDGLTPRRYAVVDVIDTGVGMPPELLSHVLEPFFTTKEAGRGTGLGLSMVAGIMKRAGGDIRIASSHGNGTRVSLYFLAAQEAQNG